MSRSRKRNAYVWITKRWTDFKERAFRKRMKQVMHDIETDFDPDRDWEEANQSVKGSGAEYGTRCGFGVKPNPDDTLWTQECYEEMLRK